jgi:thermitase
MNSLKYTVPILIIISVIWGLPIAHADVLSNNNIQSYTEYNYEYKAEINTVEDIIPSEIINDASSYWQTINDAYLSRQWPLSKIDIPALSQFEEKEPILVAVLDTGIDKEHEDLSGKVIAAVNLSDSLSPDDLNGHGTFVAGIIAANINNGIGIAGIAPNCRLINVKVADDQGSCRNSDVARGIIWATDHGAKVINVSIELDKGFHRLEEAVKYAWEQGALIISAASNQIIAPVYPAYYESCIAVVAIDKYDNEGPLIGYGDWVDVAAPGLIVFSTLPNDSYGYQSGTSFAVAHVSALASLLFSIAEDTNFDGKLNDEVKSAILNGAQKIGANSFKNINVAESIYLIQ